ncbi:MAG: hypothetical protein ACAH80_00845 [Alphaproteobacteria bacterium]
MIYESSYYKNELQAIASRMRKRLQQKRWTDRSFFLLEKDVFYSFYIIRKLIEAPAKISSKTVNLKIKLSFYKPTNVKPNYLNRFEFYELYNLEKPNPIQKKLGFICNQFVHSYIFCPDFSEDGKFLGLFFNSDFERKNGLYQIRIKDVINLCEEVARDYPNNVQYSYNFEKQDYDITC